MCVYVCVYHLHPPLPTQLIKLTFVIMCYIWVYSIVGQYMERIYVKNEQLIQRYYNLSLFDLIKIVRPKVTTRLFRRKLDSAHRDGGRGDAVRDTTPTVGVIGGTTGRAGGLQ